MRRYLPLVLSLALLCACPYEKKEPKVVEREWRSGGGGAPAHHDEARQELTANDPNRAPVIAQAWKPRPKKKPRKGRHRPAEDAEMGDMPDEDMGPDDPDEPKDPAEAKKPQEKPEEEPKGPLIQRKHQGDDAAPPDTQVDVSQIKALPTNQRGRVKFPPPPENEADRKNWRRR